MPWHRSPVSLCVRSVVCIPVAMTVLFVAPAAKTETEGASAPNPDNVLTLRERPSEMFSRWMGMPTAAAAATRTTQRPQRVRVVKPKKQTEPATARPQQAEPQAAESGWPSAAATVGLATLVPITVKTVREMMAPATDTPIVSENELSDIDLKARPVPVASPEPSPGPMSTDGRSAPEADSKANEPSIFAMAETMTTIAQSAWLEPVLLALAGALAALSAIRIFARP